MERKRITVLLIFLLTLSSITTAFAYAPDVKQNINFDRLNENYSKAITELENIIPLHKYNFKAKRLNLFSDNLVVNNSEVEYTEYFEDNNTILIVTENDYAIATKRGDGILIIDYNNGKRQELIIDLDKILSSQNKKEISTDIGPYSHDYTTEVFSPKGYYEYYEMRGGGNYRLYTLTIPRSNGSSRSNSRGTSSSSTQTFEYMADQFLENIYEAQDLESSVEDGVIDLGVGLFLKWLSNRAKDIEKAISITMSVVEVTSTLTNTGAKAGLMAAIDEGIGYASDEIGEIKEYADYLFKAYDFIQYRLIFEILNDNFELFGDV